MRATLTSPPPSRPSPTPAQPALRRWNSRSDRPHLRDQAPPTSPPPNRPSPRPLSQLSGAEQTLTNLTSGASEADLAAAEQAVANARSQLSGAEQTLTNLTSGASEADLATARSNVAAAKTQLNNARTQAVAADKALEDEQERYCDMNRALEEDL